MTSQKMPRICDFCAKPIVNGKEYKTQISERNSEVTKKGQFVKVKNEADMCHNCFMNICKNGFKPKWVLLEKVELDNGKSVWQEKEDFIYA